MGVGGDRLVLTALLEGNMAGITICTGGWVGPRTRLDAIIV
jgi:hypothetical protein